jgi:ribosome-associated toxin RatA of RatAB toxin-antitoxin module
MTRVKRSALVNHSTSAMYQLVNDVASYPQFMDGCRGVEIIEHTEHSMVAELQLKKAGVEVKFTTVNTLTPDASIEMRLQDGPFKSFRGLWLFTALTDSACKVSLDLEFDFNHRGMGVLGAGLFSGVANNLVDALCKRADTIL